MMDVVFSSTTRLAAAIQARHISATEVLEAHLAQIDKHNRALNAVVIMNVERAYQRAREADEALAHDQVWGPLHGVPFTLKDAHSTADMRTTTGFPLLDHVPREDSAVTTRLKAAGGILIGKTNLAELLADFQSISSSGAPIILEYRETPGSWRRAKAARYSRILLKW
jgi:amidase